MYKNMMILSHPLIFFFILEQGFNTKCLGFIDDYWYWSLFFPGDAAMQGWEELHLRSLQLHGLGMTTNHIFLFLIEQKDKKVLSQYSFL